MSCVGGSLALVGPRSPAPEAQPSRVASRPFGARSLPRSPRGGGKATKVGRACGPCPWHDHLPSKNDRSAWPRWHRAVGTTFMRAAVPVGRDTDCTSQGKVATSLMRLNMAALPRHMQARDPEPAFW